MLEKQRNCLKKKTNRPKKHTEMRNIKLKNYKNSENREKNGNPEEGKEV